MENCSADKRAKRSLIPMSNLNEQLITIGAKGFEFGSHWEIQRIWRALLTMLSKRKPSPDEGGEGSKIALRVG